MNDRIRTYIERAPEAISGQGGHNTTLRVARALYNGFALSRDQVLEWLQVYNSRLSERWTARELEHKADSAARGRYDKLRGWMLGPGRSEPRRIVIGAAKNASQGWKPTKKYVLATDAMDVFYSQPTKHARTRARAQSYGESEITVASVADASKNPEALALTSATPGPKRPALEESARQAPTESLGRPSPPDPEDFGTKRIAGEFMLPLARDRWSAKVLTGNAQPRTPKERHAFLMAAFDPEDVFDFSNPSDVEEYKRVNQPIM